MSLITRPAVASDANSIGKLAREFANYLRDLGDLTQFSLTAETYLRDGFGPSPAFSGVIAEERGRVIGYLLYHLGYDSDRARRNLHIVDLYVDQDARRHGVGKALMHEASRIAGKESAEEMIWSVYFSNDLAKTFYTKLGAERITEVQFMRIKADLLR